MPENSTRSEELPQSPIRKLFAYAQAAKTQGVEVIHLNIGQPDIHTPESALQVIKDYDVEVVKYGSSSGKTQLRKAIADHYTKYVAAIDLEQVFVTTGASEAIQFVLFTAMDASDEIIIPQPFYANYIGYAQMADISIVPINTDINSAFTLPSITQFEELITDRTKAIFLCNPNNPTGQLYTELDLKALALLAKKHDLYLVVDEVYRPFVYADKFYSALSLKDMDDHVVVIDSISKVFSACGARVGCVVTRNSSLLDSIEKYGQLRLSPPDFGQELAIACYSIYDEYIGDVKQQYKARRDVAYSRLSQIEGVKTYLPPAAFYNMIELPIDNAEDFCIWLLSSFTHNGKTLMLAPANGFYRNQELGKRQVRLAFVLNVEKLNQAFDILEAGLKAYKQR